MRINEAAVIWENFMPRFRHRSLIGFTGLALLCPAPLLAQDRAPIAAPTEEPSAQGDVAVTIYNNDLAWCRMCAHWTSPAGRSRIEFPDVSSRIRPETLSFAAAGAAIAEQNFDFDLLSPDKLMEKAIGQTITLVRTNPATGAETRERATVLSTAGGVVVRIGDHIEVLRDDGLAGSRHLRPRAARICGRGRPCRSRCRATAAGTRPASIRYLTPGLGWAADYVALYDETKGAIDMQGWVTLTNQTGTSFVNAATVLVAGSPMVTRHGEVLDNQYNRPPPQSGMVRAGTEKTKREQLGDYLSLSDRRAHHDRQRPDQAGGLPRRRRACRRARSMAAPSTGCRTTRQPVNVASQIAFSTSRDGGLGDALPAGTVRFYQRDSQGTPQFIGENTIGHTPMGSELCC